jgi:hypothetical protein
MANLDYIATMVGAIIGLGIASMGLVDATKIFWGGPSRFGMSHITNAIRPFLMAGNANGTIFQSADLVAILRANWTNGVAIGEQKARARSLIHLLITKPTAPAFAKLTGTDPDLLAAAVAQRGMELQAGPGAAAIHALGHFDAILSAVLDKGYQRADQVYRNASKVCALTAAVSLAFVTAPMLGLSITEAILVALCAAPLAPMVKDLTSSLQAAATAMKIVRR